MIAWRVHLNGKPVATAGIERGVVSAIANWVSLSDAPEPDRVASFSLAGLDRDNDEHFEWFRTNLNPGDEITLRLVEADRVDSPTPSVFAGSKDEVKRILDGEFRQMRQDEPVRLPQKPMVAFQVHLNGMPVATAGVERGVISVFANCVFVPRTSAGGPAADWTASLAVAGLDDNAGVHLEWFRTNLKRDDEISLKFVEADRADITTPSPSEKSMDEG